SVAPSTCRIASRRRDPFTFFTPSSARQVTGLILDLGFFHAIQSVQYAKRAYSVDSLIAAVNSAFAEMEVYTHEKCFLTLQAVMEQVMLAGGSNNYDWPRVKAFHFADGNFSHALPCSDAAYALANSTRNNENYE
ncbi:TPA: hypothetical protein N0F65_008756, partial [Lagenidium giganteum]